MNSLIDQRTKLSSFFPSSKLSGLRSRLIKHFRLVLKEGRIKPETGHHDKEPRLLHGLKKNLNDEQKKEIISLADKCIAKINSLGQIPAGYTYIGQMIAHDIVPPTQHIKPGEITEAKEKHTPERTRKVTAALNLDSIYGYMDEDILFEDHYFDNEGKFKLGLSDNGVPIDLPRDDDYKAIIPEERNDHNDIIAQLHALWQWVHNRIVDDCIEDINNKNKHEIIVEAQKIVTLIFQSVIRDDYLNRVLDKDVYEIYFSERKLKQKHFVSNRYLGDSENPKRKKSFQLPVEFTHAVFRFGHSMVREMYELSKGKKFSLVDLMRKVKHKTKFTGISADHKIDWNWFFNDVESGSIDLSHAQAMKKIPDNNSTSGPTFKHIAKLNLQSGVEQGLPSGYEAATWICENHKYLARKTRLRSRFYRLRKLLFCGIERRIDIDLDGVREIIKGPENKDGVRFLGGLCGYFTYGEKVKKLPLWLYILVERSASKKQQYCGYKLGKLGSIIVAEVLMMSMSEARYSIFKNNVDNSADYQQFNSFRKQYFQFCESICLDNDAYRDKFTMKTLLSFLGYGYPTLDIK